MKRITLVAASLLPALAWSAEAQIIQPSIRTQPVAWTSLAVGWFQQGEVCGADACWDFGGAPQFRVTLERPLGSRATLGVAATAARAPLIYRGGLLGGSCSSCDADANVTQFLGQFHMGGSGSGFHQVVDVSAGATMYSNFRGTDGTRLGPGGASFDVTFGVGYGFGVALSPRTHVTLVQGWGLTLHERQPGRSENTSVQQTTRIGARFGLGN